MDKRRTDLKEIFCAAIEKKTQAERSAYLDEACGDDKKLRAEVEALLKAHYEADNSFLTAPPGIEGTLNNSPLTEGPGTKIGRYKLLQLIGEGGFGVVYMAEQEEPIRRRVALKIIKLGMDTKQVIARFEAERQALALMDHPNIARVLDAGATDTGRPYFVMELVKGILITDYCDKNNINTRQRLELFIDVCKAVQHAHQKGIIHRDIKPSNVMITLHDGKPVPKIIDFGIAKATQQRLTEKTLFTEYRHFIGTPEYMSPEQAEMSGLDVDTRSDIYSLGVLLYELLTSTTPFEAEKLRSAAYDEIRRIIREDEPPKPSTRLNTLGDTLTDIAKHRNVQPDQLCKIVRGDLDWVVMKTLEKDRNRRYETANELAKDIERHLSDEPVVASPPSTVYRLHKFARRHRTGVVFGLLVTAALVVGLTLATVGFVQASREQNRAEANLTVAQQAIDEIYLGVAKEQLSEKAEIKDSDRELLQKTLTFYERFAEQNRTVVAARYETARAYHRVGDIYYVLGQYEQGVQAYRKARQAFERLIDEFPEGADYLKGLAESSNGLASSYLCLGDYEKAEQFVRRAIDLSEKVVSEFGEDPTYRQGLATCYYRLGQVLIGKGKLDEAEQVYRSAFTIRKELVRETPDVHKYRSSLADSHISLGLMLQDKGELDEAEQAYRRALAIGEELVREFPDVPEYRSCLAINYDNLGRVLQHKDKLDEAEQAHRSSLAINEQLAREFPSVPEYRLRLATNYNNLGIRLCNKGKFDEAEQTHRSALAIQEELVREFPDVPTYRSSLADSHISLGLMLQDKGELDAAEQAYRIALAVWEELAREFPGVPRYRSYLASGNYALGIMLKDKGEPEETKRAFRSALAIREELVREFPDVPEYRSGLACSHLGLGFVLQHKDELDEAEQAYRSALAIEEELVREFPDVPGYRSELACCKNLLAILLKDKGELDAAEQTHRGTLAIWEELVCQFPDVPEHRSRLAASNSNLGLVLKDKGELDAAEQAYRSALAIGEELVRQFPDVPEYRWELAWYYYPNLRRLLHRMDRSNEAQQANRSTLAICEELARQFPSVPKYRDHLAWAANELSWFLATTADLQLRNAEEAVELARKAVAAAPQASTYWHTLAVACYRAGKWEDAITAAGKSRELGAGGHEGIDLFFLAMAHWQLGQKDEAYRWYNQAVEWMEQKQAGTNEEDNRRFRAETESLLGISEEAVQKGK